MPGPRESFNIERVSRCLEAESDRSIPFDIESNRAPKGDRPTVSVVTPIDPRSQRSWRERYDASPPFV